METILENSNEITDEEAMESHTRRVRKFFKIGGCLQIVVGVVAVTIGIISGGTLVIPIIGGYLIANGLLILKLKS